MNLRKSLLLIALAIAAPTFSYAKDKPVSQKIDVAATPIPAAMENRIVRYTYSPDVIFRIACSPTLHTHIELGEDEGLAETPQTGDASQWRASGGPRNLYVKPLREDIDTSFTVVTNKRTYQFQLISVKKGGEVYQKVSFYYPDREAEITLAKDAEVAKVSAESKRLSDQIVEHNVDPATFDYAYDIYGNAAFKPTTVYNNGKFTYLIFRNIQDLPAIFLLDEEGNPSLVNFSTREPNVVIIERVAKNLLLKLGETEVKIGHRKDNQKKDW